MKRIGIVVPAWVGHLNPTLCLARHLQRRGNDVVIFSFPESVEQIRKAALRWEVIGADVFPDGEWERRTRELSVLKGFVAARYTLRWLERIADVMIGDLRHVLRKSELDGLVMDQVCFGAEAAAEERGLPLVVACNALPVHLQPDVPIHSETWAPSTGKLAQFRNLMLQHLLLILVKPMMKKISAAHGSKLRGSLYQRQNEIPPSLAHITQLPECFDFPRRNAPDHFHHTGPWHEPSAANGAEFDWEWLDGGPLIYASLGTLQNGLGHLYQTILDACSELPAAQVVLALGRQSGTPPERIPANAKIVGYAPQLALLRKAFLVITHAGMNTTLESLTQGLPMVALPITNEQPGIAARIRHAGVGDWLPIRALSPARLRACITKVSSDERYRTNARACARQINEQPGLDRAAAIIEYAISERRRITRKDAPVLNR